MSPMPLPDLGPVKELLATLASSLAVIKAWKELRDPEAAEEKMKDAYEVTARTDEIANVVSEMESVIPLEVWKQLETKLRKCSDYFCKIMASEGEYLPQVVDDAVNPYRVCVCKVLAVILKIYGKFPLRAHADVWTSWNCPVLLGEQELIAP